MTRRTTKIAAITLVAAMTFTTTSVVSASESGLTLEGLVKAASELLENASDEDKDALKESLSSLLENTDISEFVNTLEIIPDEYKDLLTHLVGTDVSATLGLDDAIGTEGDSSVNFEKSTYADIKECFAIDFEDFDGIYSFYAIGTKEDEQFASIVFIGEDGLGYVNISNDFATLEDAQDVIYNLSVSDFEEASYHDYTAYSSVSDETKSTTLAWIDGEGHFVSLSMITFGGEDQESSLNNVIQFADEHFQK